MKKHIEVVAAIIKENGLYFCAQRGGKGELAFKWEFPGGKIEEGESHIQALKREIKEELNTVISVQDYIMTIDYEYNTFYLTMHCYLCAVIEGNLEISEHIDFKWATISEMLQMDFAPADVPIINLL